MNLIDGQITDVTMSKKTTPVQFENYMDFITKLPIMAHAIDDEGLLINASDLWPGESVNLMVPTQTARKVVAIPRDALVIRRSGAYVYTVVEGKSHKVDVITGIAQGDMIEAKGLLSAGDVVIVRGNERLMNDQAVNIIDN